MDFEERKRKYTKRIENKNKQIIFGIDNALMNLFCSYALSENKSIHAYSMNNLNKLMNIINESNFNNNQILIIKYRFLLCALAARACGLSKEMILSDISRKMNITNLFDENEFGREISNEEVLYVENTIGQFLNTIVFDNKINDLLKLCQSYQTADYIKRQQCLSDIRNIMTNTLTQFRRNDASEVTSSTRFVLSRIDESIEDIHAYITNPSFKLITGMKGMNDLLGGGLQKTKVYCFFGMSGEGKTTTLTNLFYQVWKYNKGFKTSDPTKKPCIILFTMENLVIEYICNLFNIITQGKDIKNCATVEDVMQEFKERKFEYLGDEDIEIVIDYKAVGTKDTSYCYQLIEEMEDEGYETIAFFMDYLMRINPTNYIPGDNYNNLGQVVNEFKNIAIVKQIPFVTASQLNREAAKIIDEGRNKDQKDLVKRLGRATIGDSVQIDRNLDGLIILVPEYDAYGRKYMAYRLIKHRYDVFVPYSIIYQPFYPTSPLALMEDVYEFQQVFRTTLSMDNEDIQNYFKNAEKIGMMPLQTQQITELVQQPIQNITSEENGQSSNISNTQLNNNVDSVLNVDNIVVKEEKNKQEISLVPKDIIISNHISDSITNSVSDSISSSIPNSLPKREIITTIPQNMREQMYDVYFPDQKSPFEKYFSYNSFFTM